MAWEGNANIDRVRGRKGREERLKYTREEEKEEEVEEKMQARVK